MELTDVVKTMADHIEAEKCVLFLGPDTDRLSTGESPRAKAMAAMVERNRNRIVQYNEQDGFMLFNKPSDRMILLPEIKNIYAQEYAAEILAKIAEIPFHLIISVIPDESYKNIYDDLFGKDISFGYFSKNPSTLSEELPTKNAPLLYNIFGSTREDESMVLTFDDLFTYLMSIFNGQALPHRIIDLINRASEFVFIGFQFERWYFQLMLKLLMSKNAQEPQLIRFASPRNDNARILSLCENNFQINFIDEPTVNFIRELHRECESRELIRTKDKIFSETLPTEVVYISYRWHGLSEEVANEVYQKLKARNFKVIIDKVDAGYKTDIVEFMKEIGTGRCVVVVISDAYLKSLNCMFELLEIKKNNAFRDRIFPVVLDDAKIYNDADIFEYSEYWRKEVVSRTEELNRLAGNIAANPEIITTLTRIIEIQNNFSSAVKTVSDMNTLNVAKLRLDGFKPLIDAIRNHL